MFDIVTVGHICIDSISLPGRQTPVVVLGGSAAFVSLAASRLEARAAVVSKVGNDFPEAYRWWLEQEHINLSGLFKLSDAQTTRFELKYNDDLSDRTLQLKAKAPPMTVEDLPNPLKASAVHLAPIAGEISYEVAESLRKCADVLSLDPQGLVRNFDENGNVSHSALADTRMLSLIDVYKSSQRELEAVTGISELHPAIKAVHDHGVKIVIVTLGARGAVLSFEDAIHDIPTCTPAKVVDPTGAGDAFIGGFLSEYVDGANIPRCACVGSAVASFVVEGIGPLSFGDKTQVYERARAVYEKEIKQ